MRYRINLYIFLILFANVTSAVHCQDDDQIAINGKPLENIIAGHNFAARLRLEAVISDDDENLLDDDINYKRFPKQMYAAEVSLFENSGFKACGTYDYWENNGYLSRRESISLDIPVWNKWKLKTKYTSQDYEGASDKQYYYLGMDKFITPKFYTYTRYQYINTDNTSHGNQLYEYISYKPDKTFRFGGVGAFTDNSNTADSWYLKLFASKFLIKNSTSARLEIMHYQSDADFDAQEYKLFFYQRLGSRAFLKPSFRYYHDSQGNDSYGPGLKLKYYFSPEFSAHIGYRYSEYNEDIKGINTFVAGISVVF